MLDFLGCFLLYTLVFRIYSSSRPAFILIFFSVLSYLTSLVISLIFHFYFYFFIFPFLLCVLHLLMSGLGWATSVMF